MKSILMSGFLFLSTVPAMAAFECVSGQTRGLLQIEELMRNGYARAFFFSHDGQESDLAAVSYAGKADNFIGTLLDDEGDDLGSIEVRGTSARMCLHGLHFQCQKINLSK
ncbi:MAG: hypothetical protein KF802_15895 [Bdellovibrionaceae bacterium]|nr:hypothetical protein [Pseudobdellovibrionaceae bacterium]MBX3035049.1 hypothetical protein [Pseudobdellovibrionaceae bacterium]